jgi:hypothetical protein
MRLLLIILFISTPIYAFQSTNTNDVTVDSVIPVINEALVLAQTSINSGQLIIESANVTFQTVLASSETAGVNLWLINTKRTWSREQTSTMVFKYGKPKPKAQNKSNFMEEVVEKNVETLKDIIVNASTLYTQMGNVNELVKKGFDVSLSFKVSTDDDGGLEFEILGIGANFSGSEANTLVHTIALSFTSQN